MSIKIITDSPSDLLLSEGEKLQVNIVPLNIHIGEESYKEGIDITTNIFYDKLKKSDKLPTTSAPSPDDYLAYYQEAKEAGDDVIVITLASALSATYQSANIAKDMLDYPKIHVVDSTQATIGQLLIVKYAISLRDEGKSAEEIVNIIENAKTRVKLLAVFDTLDYLHKGGRLPKTVAIASGLLNIKPIIKLENGSLNLIASARGYKSSLKRLLKLIDSYGNINPKVSAIFGYTGNTEEAINQAVGFKEQVDAKYNLDKTELCQIGSVIGTHAGPKAFGIAFLKD